MDDSGAGYSGLDYLRRLPFGRVKMARGLVSVGGLDGGGDRAALARAAAGSCGSSGVAVAAEGIETRARLDRVAAGGRTEGHGRSSGRPVPAREAPGSLGRPLGVSPERAAA